MFGKCKLYFAVYFDLVKISLYNCEDYNIIIHLSLLLYNFYIKLFYITYMS